MIFHVVHHADAWNAAVWIQQFTRNMDTEPATKVWGTYNLSQSQFEVLQDYRALVVERCSKQFKVPMEQLQVNPTTDKNAMSRLSFWLCSGHSKHPYWCGMLTVIVL